LNKVLGLLWDRSTGQLMPSSLSSEIKKRPQKKCHIGLLQLYNFFHYFSVNELLKMKEDLTKERDEQLAEVVKLREQLAESQSKQTKLETDQEDAISEI
jgi:hypothetical protein